MMKTEYSERVQAELDIPSAEYYIRRFWGTTHSWGSSHEHYLAYALEKIGAPKFYQQFQFGPRRVDFLFPEARVIIEVNGPFHDTPRQVHRDQAFAHLVKELGFLLVEIPIEEIERRGVKVAFDIWSNLETWTKNRPK